MALSLESVRRNSLLLVLLTLGEGWHNNHHYYRCTRQSFFWWELDVAYYLLRGLQAAGLVWDLREPPAHILRSSSSRAPAGAGR